jgi:hypothetical protein
MSLATVDGRLCVISGSSRCGKTTKTERLIRPFKTVFVWDIEAQWCELKGFTKVTSLVQLKKLVVAGKTGKFAYVSGGDIKADFELFCMCVFYYGDNFGMCAVVAEELADVTNVSKAGANWGKLCRRGLKRNISIFAISQRWAEADKTAIGNATDFFVFMQSTKSDAKYMSDKTDIEYNQIWALNKLEYFHLRKEGKVLRAEKLKF